MGALEQLSPDVLMRLASAVHAESGSLDDLGFVARVWLRALADVDTDDTDDDGLWRPYEGLTDSDGDAQ